MPGFWQIDTVHHCGQTAGCEYNLTLTATDVCSGRINLCALLNKAHKWTFEALDGVKNNASFPILEFHSDNGSEFINNATELWCAEESPAFTRSRDRKKKRQLLCRAKKLIRCCASNYFASASMPVTAGSPALRNKPSLRTFIRRRFLCSISLCLHKSSKAKPG
ncbi:MAG: hypothetical protein Pg6C_00990 [Treponemataceae bacterium]|nr:MAG: hypothetical protein Pg6C_00990 [Treponemataceae bacterium]